MSENIEQNFIDNIHPTLKIRLEKHIVHLKMKGVPAEEIDILRAGAMGLMEKSDHWISC